MKKIETLINSPDEDLRLQGLQLLGDVKGEPALGMICRSLGDESWRVRKSAVEIIVLAEEKDELLPYLVKGLRSEDNAGMRNSAAEALERIGKAAVEFLLNFIDDEDHDLRKSIIDILGTIGDERATPFLIEALSDSDENVKSAAAESLGRIGDDHAVNSLLETLQSEDLLLKFSSLEALSRIGKGVPYEDIIPHLENPLLKKAALEVLGKSEEIKALPYLAKGVKDRSKSTKEAALIALVVLLESHQREAGVVDLIGTDCEDLGEHLIPCLGSGNEETVLAAIKLLGWLRCKEAIKEMLKWATVENIAPYVRNAVVDIGAESEEELIGNFAQSPDDVKPFICYLLGEISSGMAEPLLVSALKSTIGHVRHSSALSLGKIGNKDSIAHLQTLLDDEYEDVRDAAVQALSMLVDVDRAEVLKIVEDGIHSDRIDYRLNCAKILVNMGKKGKEGLAISASKDESGLIRKYAVEALGEFDGEEALEHIVLALSDEEKDVRIAAIDTLCRVGSESSFDSILAVTEDEDIWVRCAAIRGIATLGKDRAAPHLVRMLGDELGLIVVTALEALGRLELPEFAPSMLELVERNDGEVLKAAIENLAFWNNQKYLDMLISFINHSNWEIRILSAKILAKKLKGDALPFLTERLKVEEDELVKSTIEQTLSSCRE